MVTPRACPACGDQMETGDNRCTICGQSQGVPWDTEGQGRNQNGFPSDEEGGGTEGRGVLTCSLAIAMQDLITHTREEGDFLESVRGLGSLNQERNNVDLNNYKPVQSLPFNEHPLRILTVNHELGKNILGIQFERRVAIYKLERVRDNGEEYFSLTKLQEFTPSASEGMVTKSICSFSINPSSNIGTFGERSLSYAFNFEQESKFYLVSEKKKSPGSTFTKIKTLQSEDVMILDGHQGSVRHLAFDAERGELLSSLSDDSVCVIWGVETQQQVSRLALRSPGVVCLWHKSEPYKLLIVEEGGVIRMYNTLKQSTILTINTLVQPIYSADWSTSDSQLVGVGANKCAYTFDLSLLNSEPGKRVETHSGATHRIKFSTTDSQQFTTATMSPRPEIKTYQKNFRNYVWSGKQQSIQDIGWIYGEPFLMALAGKQLLIYESNLI